MRSQGFKRARNIAVSVLVLLVVLVGGGLAYTYFFGPDSSQNATATPPPVPPTAPDLKPSKIAPNAPTSASVETLTSPAAPGSNASITIKSTPGAACKIAVVYGGVASTDSGLAPKNADEYGVVMWTWTVDSKAALGTWPIKVTCVHNTKSAMVQGDQVIAK